MNHRVTSRPMGANSFEPRGASPINRAAAVFLWLLACVTTWQAVAAVTPGMLMHYQIIIGVALQAIFTVLESPTLRGKPNGVSLAVLLIDALVNAGGVFAYVIQLGTTPTGQMVSAVLGTSAQVTPLAGFAMAMVSGVLLAAAPEAVWRWRG